MFVIINCGIMETNKNGNKGVFPGTQAPPQGVLQAGQTVTSNQKPNNVAHHETSFDEIQTTTEAVTTDGAITYIRLETTNSEQQISGIIEVDLISFREKGQESRFLSINTTGADAEGNGNSVSINIDNEADFNKFKKFISELNWND